MVSKGNCEVLQLGEKQTLAYGVYDGVWQAGKQFFWKGLWGVWVTPDWTQSSSVYFLVAKRQSVSWAALEGVLPRHQEGILPSHPDESSSHSAVPTSPVQQRHGHTGKSLVAPPRIAGQALADTHLLPLIPPQTQGPLLADVLLQLLALTPFHSLQSFQLLHYGNVDPLCSDSSGIHTHTYTHREHTVPLPMNQKGI